MSRDCILGLSLMGHDLSAALVDSSGQLLFVAEEERYSHVKGGSFVFHPRMLSSVLVEFGIDEREIGTIAIAGDPSFWQQSPQLPFSAAARTFHFKAWERVLTSMALEHVELVRLRHHMAHAACAWLTGPWDSAAIVTADAFGDGEVATIWSVRRGELNQLSSDPFPHSLPYLYRAFATWLGLRGWEREGKMMALASYGEPRHAEKIRELFCDSTTGSWRLSRRLVGGLCQIDSLVEGIEAAMGPRRRPDEPLLSEQRDIAASVQSLLEQELLARLLGARQLTRAQHCCLAGGAFLNSVAVGKLIRAAPFDELFVPPFASDSGLAIGAALYVAHQQGLPRFHLSQASLGSPLILDEVPRIAKEFGLKCHLEEDSTAWAAHQLARGSVLGWCQGRMEAGPRALGHRSILGDPRRSETHERITQLKGREPWRPFAPAMLEEDTPFWLGRCVSAPYMAAVFRILHADLIPAVVHCDGTARVQTVDAARNFAFNRLLSLFKESTGMGVILNTSLNIQGKPIARTVRDCLEFLVSSGIDHLVIADYVVERGSVTYQTPPASTFGNVPPRFHLAVYDPEDQMRDFLARLRAEALVTIELPPEAVFSPASLLATRLKPCPQDMLMVVIPWFIDVAVETLPRVIAQILDVEAGFSNVTVMDAAGESRSVEALVNLSAACELRQRDMTDVERHFRDRIWQARIPRAG